MLKIVCAESFTATGIFKTCLGLSVYLIAFVPWPCLRVCVCVFYVCVWECVHVLQWLYAFASACVKCMFVLFRNWMCTFVAVIMSMYKTLHIICLEVVLAAESVHVSLLLSLRRCQRVPRSKRPPLSAEMHKHRRRLFLRLQWWFPPLCQRTHVWWWALFLVFVVVAAAVCDASNLKVCCWFCSHIYLLVCWNCCCSC